jgi:hypothetical protein
MSRRVSTCAIVVDAVMYTMLVAPKKNAASTAVCTDGITDQEQHGAAERDRSDDHVPELHQPFVRHHERADHGAGAHHGVEHGERDLHAVEWSGDEQRQRHAQVEREEPNAGEVAKLIQSRGTEAT